jgi:NitT/TauT family transport system substrate-binding protein
MGKSTQSAARPRQEIVMKPFARTLAAVVAISCVAGAAQAQETVLRVGIAKALATAATMIAVEKGYFRDAGIKIQIEELDSAANVMALLAQGQLQVVEGGISVGFFNAIERGLPIGIVADRVSTPLSHKLLIRKDLVGKIKTPGDLKGKIVASNGPGAVTTYEVAKILARDGVGVKDIDIKVLSFVNMGVALTNKAVDAALVIQPWASQYVDQGIAEVFADPDDYADPKPLTIAVNLVNTDWASKNRELVRNYFVAYQHAVYDYCQAYHGGGNRQEVKDIIVRTGLEPRKEVLDRYPWPARNPNGHINLPSVLDMQKYYLKEGLAQKEMPVDKIVDNEYVDYATQKLGPFKLENTASKLEGCR